MAPPPGQPSARAVQSRCCVVAFREWWVSAYDAVVTANPA
jgi:hypothetical protein